MMKRVNYLLILLTVSLSACAQQDQKITNLPNTSKTMNKVVKTDEEWKKQLTPEQYRIARKKGTEYAFTGEYYNNHEKGMYYCACCGNPLFSSDTKFDSGTGWPSFWAPADKEDVNINRDSSLGMVREE